MTALTRRDVLRSGVAVAIPPGLVALMTGCHQPDAEAPEALKSKANGKSGDIKDSKTPNERDPMNVHYLEIVTPKVDALCDQYAKIHGVTFSEPVANLGGARTAKIDGGGMIGIRGPLRETETPVVRPYTLVENLEKAVAAAKEAGAEVAIPSMEIPGHGTIAIVILGGIECGLWQN